MSDVEKKMAEIKSKKNPDSVEVKKYVRYMVNINKYDKDSILEEVPHWDPEDVEKAFKDVQRENAKPSPKRFYVSLKEPLEDARLK